MLGADAPLQLERRRDLAFLRAEVAREDGEALDPLETRELRVHAVDDLLHALLHVGRGQPVGHGRVERDQRRHVGPTVADDERLRDEWRGLERVLEVLRRDVLASRGHKDVLLAVGDPDEAVLVDFPEVAGAQPAVLAEHLARCLLVLVVAGEDRLAPDQQLAVLVGAHLEPRERRPDGAEPEPVGLVIRSARPWRVSPLTPGSAGRRVPNRSGSGWFTEAAVVRWVRPQPSMIRMSRAWKTSGFSAARGAPPETQSRMRPPRRFLT